MDKKILIVDTETGGLDPLTSSILSVGAVIWNNGVLEDTYYSLIAEPEIVADPKALAVNGLSLDQIKAEGKTTTTVAMDLMNFCEKYGLPYRCSLGGHNVRFDEGFLKRLFRLAGLPWKFSHLLVDTQQAGILLQLAGKLPIKSTKLDDMTAFYKINVREGGKSGKHNALEDASATGLLLTRVLKELGWEPPAREQK